MKCRSCGAELESGVKECPYCDAIIEIEDTQNTVVQQQKVEKEKGEVVEKKQETIKVNENAKIESVCGKKYSFISAAGANFWGVLSNRITNDVELTDDRLLIETRPKRFNSAPGVMYEDILDISICRKFTFMAICYLVLSVLLISAGGVGIILLIIWLLVGRHSVIKISQRNGKTITLYSRDKDDAEMFKEDMKKVAKIK